MLPGYMTRRALLRHAIGIGTLSVGTKLLAASCAVPGGPDSSMRTELHYVEASTDPGKQCAGCAFFSNLQGGCGTCQILNGPANPNGHCDSWAARG
jgi:hypothetical protein